MRTKITKLFASSILAAVDAIFVEEPGS